MSNITPQKSDLNRGPWLKLERKVRQFVSRTEKNLYVITGPIYERKMLSLPKADEKHQIPSGYWKVIALKDGNKINTAAFIFDQETNLTSKLTDHITTIDDIEKRSGLNLFWELLDKVEEIIESNKNEKWILEILN